MSNKGPDSNRRRAGAMAYAKAGGGARPLASSISTKVGRARLATGAEPASIRLTVEEAAADGMSGPATLPMHAGQCVDEFRWHVRSWCSTGDASTNATYSAMPPHAQARAHRFHA